VYKMILPLGAGIISLVDGHLARRVLLELLASF
jgi:hypothetical protein